VVALVVLATVLPARAHLGDISYSEIVVKRHTALYTLRFAAHLIPGIAAARASDPNERHLARHARMIFEWLSDAIRFSNRGSRCSASLTNVVGPDANDNAEVTLAYKCADPIDAIRIEFHPFDDVLPTYQNIVSLRTADASMSYVFTRTSPVLMVGSAEGEEPPGSFFEFFHLGVEHIWTGYDHLLFLLALLIPGGSIKRLAGIVTAFTVAHSLTLSLAALGVLALPSTPVEIAIAASIVFVAAENLRKPSSAGHERRDHRWLVTFVFGLIHGFGFAGVLREAGLPAGGVAKPLLAFNLGVEAGQLVVVLAVVPLLRVLMRGNRSRPIELTLSWLIISAGVFWMVERSAALLG
jgi:hypothetical protein